MKRGRIIKDTGRGRRMGRVGQALTLIIPNRRARHRAKASGFVLKYEVAYARHRWFVDIKPKIKKLFK